MLSLKNKLLLSIMLSFLFLIIFPTAVLAKSGISIDCDFSDWNDKPSILSKTPDSLELSKWYIDNSNVYFYYEGLHTYNPSKIDFTNYIDTEFGTVKLSVNYNYKAQKADVMLYDSNGNKIWSTTYRSGNDKKAENRQLELKIPIKYIVESPESGYNLNIYSDDGTVETPTTIATASTIPFIYGFAILAFCIVSINLFYNLKKKKGADKR